MTKPRAWFTPWRAVFLLAAVALLARNLYGLNASPPGMYIDEASIGYNAWAIGHYGVDEHGHHLPLFFEAFGEYKNPVYIYLLVPFVRIFGLTAAVVRTPAAILGFIACLAVTATVWHLFRSRWMAFFALLICAFTPWLTQEARLGFEVISMVAATSVAVYCLARAVDGDARWLFAAGLALTFALYGYTSGRIESAGLVAAIALIFWRKRRPKWWLVVVCPAAGYAALAAWAFANPGALTNRFNAISITAHAHSISDVVHTFVVNYLSQIGPSFLFVNGDANLRHNTGFSGELMIFTAPFVVVGLMRCFRTWRRPFWVFCLWGFFSAPVAAAVTANGNPHSLRAATMIPFAVVVTMYGVDACVQYVHGRGRLIAAVMLAALLAGEGIAYTLDEFGAYETRSAAAFDAGMPEAIRYAQAHADGHTIYLTDGVDQLYIDAFMVSPPAPPSSITAYDDPDAGLRQLRMQVADPVILEATPGDEVVASPWDVQPSGGKVVKVFNNTDGCPLAVVYRVEAHSGNSFIVVPSSPELQRCPPPG